MDFFTAKSIIESNSADFEALRTAARLVLAERDRLADALERIRIANTMEVDDDKIHHARLPGQHL